MRNNKPPRPKNVLFITFFWPPSGKATVHWPLKIAHHLPSFGWEPIVLTAEKDSFSHSDPTLLQEADPSIRVVRARAMDPFRLYRAFLGKQQDEPLIASEAISTTDRRLRQRVSIWIRMNVFVPDARVGWYWNAVRAGKEFIKSERTDAIISIGPPHTAHLVGKTLSTHFRIPHIPVFIDPWVDIVYYRNFKRNPFILMLDKRLERGVLANASKVVFVTETMKQDYESKYPWLEGKSRVLYWGYNEEDFRGLKPSRPKGKEILLHAGNIFDHQNPPTLWKTIRKEIDTGRNLHLKFIGTVGPGIRRAIEDSGLGRRTQYKGFLSYRDMIKELLDASYLLVCTTEKRHVPGKLFEYIRVGKPILAFGDDNTEVEQILKEAKAGMLFSYSTDASAFFKRGATGKTNLSALKKFDRKNIALHLAALLETAIQKQ